MITREMLFPMLFYEKAKFNGSKGKMNYRIEKFIDTETEEKNFLLTLWEGPECYDVTKKEKKLSYYPYNDEGMMQIIEVLNQI